MKSYASFKYDYEDDGELKSVLVTATGIVDVDCQGFHITDDNATIDGINIDDTDLPSEDRKAIWEMAIDRLCEWVPDPMDFISNCRIN